MDRDLQILRRGSWWFSVSRFLSPCLRRGCSIRSEGSTHHPHGSVRSSQMTSSAVINTAAIAFTEKKVDMALDDIIKMSKTKTTNSKKQMVLKKSHKFSGGNGTQKSLKVRKFMQSRSTIREGVLAQRSNLQGNRFPMATEAAKNAIVAPIRNGGFKRNRTANWNRPSLYELFCFGCSSVDKYMAPQRQLLSKSGHIHLRR